MSEKNRGNENLHLRSFIGTGKYNIPEVQPCNKINSLDFISFNYAKTAKGKEKKGVHFFLDDYQFIRLWDKADIYIDMLKKFDSVCSPDFSLYLDYPKALQIYNHYRKMWLSAYYQEYGINIIPTACWSDEDSFEFCFDGMPKNSIIAVSSIGTIHGKLQNELFRIGYEEMVRRLNPTQVLFYGLLPDWLNKTDITIIGSANDRFDKLHKPTLNCEMG